MKRLLGLLLFLAACDAPVLAYDYGPTLSQTTRLATHNSYWVNHGVASDLFSSGVGEQILDQLVIDHVRSIELDVHPDPATPHHFLVYHTAPGNDVCTDLATCLAPVLALHDLSYSHSAVIVILELKGLITPTFDADHGPEDLDAELRLNLGSLLYAPANLLARCEAGATLTACARDHGWPYEGEVAGQVLVAVLGNWNDLPGATAPSDWATYATGKPIANRAGFPMGSSWQRDWSKLSDDNHGLTDAKKWEAAWAQAAMLQVEAFDDPLLEGALVNQQIVRADGVFTAADRAVATSLGVQLWQTDWPWDAGRTTLALGALPDAPTPSAMLDMDNVVQVSPPPKGAATTHAWIPGGTAKQRVFGAIATGMAEGVTACFAAAVADDPDVDGVTWCKHKQPAARAKLGGDAPVSVNGERVTYMWRVCHAGACSTQTLAPSAEAIALEVACADGSCCATPEWLTPGRVVVAAQVSGAASNACFAVSALAQGTFVRWGPAIDHGTDRVLYLGGVTFP